MGIYYKLTDQDGYTRRGESNQTLWSEGTTHTAIGKCGLCTNGLIHLYEHPLIAVFMNPIHGNIPNPILWKCEAEVTHKEGQFKCGARTVTTIEKMELPTMTIQQGVKIAIKIALLNYSEPSFVKWANDYLSTEDNSQAADVAAYAAAYAAAGAAADAAADAAYAAANAATNAAAYAAASVAYAAADAAAYAAADAAADAAKAAAVAAKAAYTASVTFDLLQIIQSVVSE